MMMRALPHQPVDQHPLMGLTQHPLQVLSPRQKVTVPDLPTTMDLPLQSQKALHHLQVVLKDLCPQQAVGVPLGLMKKDLCLHPHLQLMAQRHRKTRGQHLQKGAVLPRLMDQDLQNHPDPTGAEVSHHSVVRVDLPPEAEVVHLFAVKVVLLLEVGQDHQLEVGQDLQLEVGQDRQLGVDLVLQEVGQDLQEAGLVLQEAVLVLQEVVLVLLQEVGQGLQGADLALPEVGQVQEADLDLEVAHVQGQDLQGADLGQEVGHVQEAVLDLHEVDQHPQPVEVMMKRRKKVLLVEKFN